MSYYFLSLLGVLLFSFFSIIAVVVFEKKSSSIKDFSALSTLPSIALNVEYFEPANRFYSDARDKLFVDMRPLSSMDFVYAK